MSSHEVFFWHPQKKQWWKLWQSAWISCFQLRLVPLDYLDDQAARICCLLIVNAKSQ
jgi:hypothetical protein